MLTDAISRASVKARATHRINGLNGLEWTLTFFLILLSGLMSSLVVIFE